MAKKGEKKSDDTQMIEDVIGSRLLALLAISIVYIFILMFIHNSITGITNILLGFTVVKVMFYVSIVLLALSVVFFIVRRVKKIDEQFRVITGANVFATFIVFFVTSALIYKYDIHAIKVMYIAIPAWFLLYMIFKLYMREFFTVSLTCTFGGAALFFMYRLSLVVEGVSGNILSSLKPANLVFLIVIVALCVLLCVFCAIAKKNHGRISSNEKAVYIASERALYPPLYIAPALIAVCLIVSLFYSQILFYGMFALVAYWLVMFVYYTYLMMKR